MRKVPYADSLYESKTFSQSIKRQKVGRRQRSHGLRHKTRSAISEGELKSGTCQSAGQRLLWWSQIRCKIYVQCDHQSDQPQFFRFFFPRPTKTPIAYKYNIREKINIRTNLDAQIITSTQHELLPERDSPNQITMYTSRLVNCTSCVVCNFPYSAST